MLGCFCTSTFKYSNLVTSFDNARLATLSASEFWLWGTYAKSI